MRLRLDRPDGQAILPDSRVGLVRDRVGRRTGVCFGLVHGIAQDFGTFDLNDLASKTVGDIPVVEREVNWPGQTVRELQEMWHRHLPGEAPYY